MNGGQKLVCVSAHGRCKIDALEQLAEVRDVLPQPEIVVGQIADQSAAGLLERHVPVTLAVSFSLGKVKEPDTPDLAHERARDIARLRGRGVADDEDLEVVDGLGQGTLHREAQSRTVAMRRNEHGDEGHELLAWAYEEGGARCTTGLLRVQTHRV